MRSQFAILALGLSCLAGSGCCLLTQSLLHSTLGAEQTNDGRDQDRDGLTERDRLARWEEQVTRRWQVDQQLQRWKKQKELQSSQQRSSFQRSWQDFVSRDRD